MNLKQALSAAYTLGHEAQSSNTSMYSDEKLATLMAPFRHPKLKFSEESCMIMDAWKRGNKDVVLLTE